MWILDLLETDQDVLNPVGSRGKGAKFHPKDPITVMGQRAKMKLMRLEH